jgi:uncharacterized protein (TIGR02246 family)
MKFSHLKVILGVGAGLAGATGSYAASATAEALPDEFMAAWNGHQADDFEKLFVDEAVWVPVAEVRDQGRDAIVKDLMVAHTTWAKKSKIAFEGERTVLHPKHDVAVLFFKMNFLDAAGQPVPGIQRAMILVGTKAADGWRISAGQLTKESPVQ